MEQQNITTAITTGIPQNEAFKKRRKQKNLIVMALILACVGLVWSVTMIKIQKGMEMSQRANPIVNEVPQKANEGGANAQ